MSLTYEKDRREQMLKRYQDEINNTKERQDIERQRRLREEQDFINKLNREAEEEKNRLYQQKLDRIQENHAEYQNLMNKKRIDNERRWEEKSLEKPMVTLDTKNEERINEFKDYVLQLNDKVDKNMDNYINYQRNSPNVSKNYYDPRYYNPRNNYEAYSHNYDKDALNNNHSDTPSKRTIEGANRTTNYANVERKNEDEELNKFIGSRTIEPSKFRPEYSKEDLDKNYFRNLNDYKNVYRQYFDFNKNISSDRYFKDHSPEGRKHLVEERLKDLEQYQRYEQEMKRYKQDRQHFYKGILDDQVRHKGSPQYSYPDRVRYEDYSYEDRNNLRSVNPYTIKQYNIAPKTSLEHNPILNPVPDFKHNKYLYSNKGWSNSLRTVGNNIIG